MLKTWTEAIQAAISTTSPIQAIGEPSRVRLDLVRGGIGCAGAAAGLITSVMEVLLRIEQAPDLSREFWIFRVEHDLVEGARARDGNVEIGQDPAGPRRHHDDAVGEEDRLRDAVRDQHDGLVVL